MLLAILQACAFMWRLLLHECVWRLSPIGGYRLPALLHDYVFNVYELYIYLSVVIEWAVPLRTIPDHSVESCRELLRLISARFSIAVK